MALIPAAAAPAAGIRSQLRIEQQGLAVRRSCGAQLEGMSAPQPQHLAHWRHLLINVAMGCASGAMAGVGAFVFLEVLDRVTDLHQNHLWLLVGLTVFGGFWGWVLSRYHPVLHSGTSLTFGTIHGALDGNDPEPLPKLLAPVVLLGTWATHLFGGSVGREGTALQMSAGLSDQLAVRLKTPDSCRAESTAAALAGGFGAVFGVPLAGIAFALECALHRRDLRNPRTRSMLYWVAVAAVPSALLGHGIVLALGHHHAARAAYTANLTAVLGLKALITGLACGLVSRLFVVIKRSVSAAFAAMSVEPAIRMATGGLVVAAALLIAGPTFRGLSLGLIDESFDGAHIVWWTFAAKLAITAVALGVGFPGGEVTPLFVVGTTFAVTAAQQLGIVQADIAAIGFVTVFAAVARTPVAGTLMAVEMFGWKIGIPAGIACAAAMITADSSGIYSHGFVSQPPADIEELAEQ